MKLLICKDQAQEKRNTLIVYWDLHAVNKPVVQLEVWARGETLLKEAHWPLRKKKLWEIMVNAGVNDYTKTQINRKYSEKCKKTTHQNDSIE